MIDIPEIISTLVYSGVGILLMLVGWIILDRLTPFSLHDEIENKNCAAAIVVGAIFLAISIIIGAVIVS